VTRSKSLIYWPLQILSHESEIYGTLVAA